MNHPSKRRMLICGAVLFAFIAALVGPSTAVTGPGSATAFPLQTWVGSWATAPTGAGAGLSGEGFDDQTIRMVVRTSIGGNATRIRLSNAFGNQPVTVGKATVALPDTSTAEPTDVLPGSVRQLRFGGSPNAVIAKGAQVLSDPLTMNVPQLTELVISVYFPEPTGPASWHWQAQQHAFYGDGDLTADLDGAELAGSRTSWFFLTGVDVLTRLSPGSVVVLGDSITDGSQSTVNDYQRWTDHLATRVLSEPPHIFDPGVLNKGLAGNAVNRDGSEIGFAELGVGGQARLHRDVFSQTGVRTLILALGINDIQIYNDDPEKIIAGLRQIAAQARNNGVRVLVCTLLPFEGFRSWTPEKEQTRLAVNAHLRIHAAEFDGLIDFDSVMRDPDNPAKLRPEWDSGDHIHPNDEGYRAMAYAVPLWLL